MSLNLRRQITISHARIEDGVVDYIRDMYVAKLRMMQRRMQTNAFARKVKEDLLLAKSLMSLLSDKDEFDKMMTTLMNLEYTSFRVVEYESKPFLVGTTKPVVMAVYSHSDHRNARPLERYNIGEYEVCIDKTPLLNGGTQNVSLLPKEHRAEPQRTPHHHGHPDQVKDPIAWTAATCLGSFGVVLGSAYRALDIPEIYRIWHMYIGRCDQGSQLRGRANSNRLSGLDGIYWKRTVERV